MSTNDLQILIDDMRDGGKSPYQRTRAFENFLKHPDHRDTLSIVNDLLADENRSLRSDVVRALARNPEVSYHPFLAHALDDADDYIKREALRGLATSNDPSIIQKVEALVETASYSLKSDAERTLKAMQARVETTPKIPEIEEVPETHEAPEMPKTPEATEVPETIETNPDSLKNLSVDKKLEALNKLRTLEKLETLETLETLRDDETVVFGEVKEEVVEDTIASSATSTPPPPVPAQEIKHPAPPPIPEPPPIPKDYKKSRSNKERPRQEKPRGTSQKRREPPRSETTDYRSDNDNHVKREASKCGFIACGCIGVALVVSVIIIIMIRLKIYGF